MEQKIIILLLLIFVVIGISIYIYRKDKYTKNVNNPTPQNVMHKGLKNSILSTVKADPPKLVPGSCYSTYMDLDILGNYINVNMYVQIISANKAIIEATLLKGSFITIPVKIDIPVIYSRPAGKYIISDNMYIIFKKRGTSYHLDTKINFIKGTGESIAVPINISIVHMTPNISPDMTQLCIPDGPFHIKGGCSDLKLYKSTDPKIICPKTPQNTKGCDYTDENDCKSVGCKWDGGKCTGTPGDNPPPPCSGDGTMCALGTTCNSCCNNASTWWGDPTMRTACGIEPADWKDGTMCAFGFGGGSCSLCTNPATKWYGTPTARNACGKEPRYPDGTTCLQGTSCKACANPWTHWLGTPSPRDACGTEPCWHDGSMCAFGIGGGSCSQCCNPATQWYGTPTARDACGVEPRYPDGTACFLGTSCNACQNPAGWSWAHMFTTCGGK